MDRDRLQLRVVDVSKVWFCGGKLGERTANSEIFAGQLTQHAQGRMTQLPSAEISRELSMEYLPYLLGYQKDRNLSQQTLGGNRVFLP